MSKKIQVDFTKVSVDFLMKVWGLSAKKGDYFCLAHNREGSTPKNTWFRWGSPGLGKELGEWLSERRDIDQQYFCPTPFTEMTRQSGFVARSRVAWADIDRGDEQRVPPSFLWETSPGSHQGIWVLPKTVSGEEAAAIGKDITTRIGADKGGWMLTKLLRIPGTRNAKAKYFEQYGYRPEVKLKENNPDHIYRKKDTAALDWATRIRQLKPRDPAVAANLKLTLDKSRFPPAAGEDRSEQIDFFGKSLVEAGVPPEEAVNFLRPTPWWQSRYADKDDYYTRRHIEVWGKHAAKLGIVNLDERAERTQEEMDGMNFVDASELEARPLEPIEWVVDGLIPRGAYGIIGGEAKTFKSTTVLDLAFAVAYDRRFLGKYPVEQGKVLMIQSENDERQVQEQLQQMREASGMPRLPKGQFLILSRSGFKLANPDTDTDHRVWAEQQLERERPSLLVLDPLYMIFRGDEKKSEDMQPILEWIQHISLEYNCTVLVIHHFNKGTAEGQRSFNRLSGSGIFGRWLAVGMFMTREGRGSKLEFELRVAAPPDAVYIEFTRGKGQSYSVQVIEANIRDSDEGKRDTKTQQLTIKDAVLDALDDGPQTFRALATSVTAFEPDPDRLRKVLAVLEQDKLIFKKGDKYDKHRS